MIIKNGYEVVRMLVLDGYYVKISKGKHSRTIEFESEISKIAVTDENEVTKEYFTFRKGDDSEPSADMDKILDDMLYCHEKTILEIW